MLQFNVIVKILIALMILASLGYYLARYAWLITSGAFVQVSIDQANDWHCVTANGIRYKASLVMDSYMMGWLIVLNFRLVATNKCISMVILPDSLAIEEWHQLRIKLRTMTKIG